MTLRAAVSQVSLALRYKRLSPGARDRRAADNHVCSSRMEDVASERLDRIRH